MCISICSICRSKLLASLEPTLIFTLSAIMTALGPSSQACTVKKALPCRLSYALPDTLLRLHGTTRHGTTAMTCCDMCAACESRPISGAWASKCHYPLHVGRNIPLSPAGCRMAHFSVQHYWQVLSSINTVHEWYKQGTLATFAFPFPFSLFHVLFLMFLPATPPS